MFTSQQRSSIREQLIAHARADAEISGAALAGSGARGEEDAWSDIDLVLQLDRAADEPAVVERWTRWLGDTFGTADTFDLLAGGVRYRVFLLPSSLQIDLSFWPHEQFRATEPSFRLLFGAANEPTVAPVPNAANAIGMGWLYALHARSALARGKLWQAVMMLDELRNQTITLACLRLGLNPWHGREADKLPAPLLEALQHSRPSAVTVGQLARSRQLLITQLLTETEFHDPARAASLRVPFEVLSADVH